ncbi:Uncharacterized conserved protein, contains ParB-like and HNH nuclease domains [Tenacibaculum sp. MAR_2010_89]|uniref:DUF262 domain-containing protein n=1 Tax=Tenacibaculum sp. MAR_2010_89 TaxID=1250198 RepID=UPI0008962420|nr:DUF262 domain-containing protein [Tenacibaculum sp. MAR_2010_89]SED59897.1 Uncharacterized conserved protein, contains ParB-like and HNH nuclease domains [Tenacibaculum sp. MAR_2010_89]
MDKLELIPVEKLLQKDFFIPSYQRGYRWKERQVIDLLEDVLEFQNKGKLREEGEFYCLQPLVITRKEIKGKLKWEVIDGQQRLTTLYLILTYFKSLLIEEHGIEGLYTIDYETRQGSWSFLEKIESSGEISKENPDYYHISMAYRTIVDWFSDKIKNKEGKKRFSKRQYLESLILTDVNESDIDTANNVRFIWYEVQTKDELEAKSIFTRINMGKIPLTNAELIKALFFINGTNSSKEREKHQQKLAYEWDGIEKSLQNKDFWFFLNKVNYSKPTKIEFIFDLIANKYKEKVSIKVNKDIDKYYTFYVFNNLISSGVVSKEELWKEVKVYSKTFDEWFRNNEYYHLIGYLIHTGKDIELIKELSNNISKSGFKKELFKLIKGGIQLNFEKNKIENLIELSYQDNSQIIRDLLLLFNVVSTMDSKYSKFPFERYVYEKWSLEHIHAQNSEDLKIDKHRKSLLEEQKIYFKSLKEENLTSKIIEILESDVINVDLFTNLQEEIFKKYTKDENVNIHSIDNMALLARADNSVLNNNIFPIKRDKIIELDEKGSFIPICTKNVFLKYYSKDVIQNSEWTKKDRKAYLIEIKKKIANYLPHEEGKNEN